MCVPLWLSPVSSRKPRQYDAGRCEVSRRWATTVRIGRGGAKYRWRWLAAKVSRGGGIRGSLFPSAHLIANAAIQRVRAHVLHAKYATEDPKVDNTWH